MIKVAHTLFGVFLAQLPIVILLFLLSGDWGIAVITLIVSAILSVVIGLPIICLLIKFNALNVLSICTTSMVIALPFIGFTKMGIWGLIFLIPSVLGGLVFWGYLRNGNVFVSSCNHILLNSSTLLVIVGLASYISIKDRSISYEDNLESHYNSYRDLDRSGNGQSN